MVTIKAERPATSEEWDQIWSSSAYATYFQSREWAEIWQDYSEGQLRPLPVLLGDNLSRTSRHLGAM